MLSLQVNKLSLSEVTRPAWTGPPRGQSGLHPGAVQWSALLQTLRPGLWFYL